MVDVHSESTVAAVTPLKSLRGKSSAKIVGIKGFTLNHTRYSNKSYSPKRKVILNIMGTLWDTSFLKTTL